MLDYIKEAVTGVKNLVPPSEGASARHVQRWRRWIAAATLLNSVGLSMHIALACGYAAPFYSGFARAGEIDTEIDRVTTQVVAVAESQKAQRIGDLEASILDAKAKHCAAAPGVRALYLASLQKMLVTYLELTKRQYPLPGCDSF